MLSDNDSQLNTVATHTLTLTCTKKYNHHFTVFIHEYMHDFFNKNWHNTFLLENYNILCCKTYWMLQIQFFCLTSRDQKNVFVSDITYFLVSDQEEKLKIGMFTKNVFTNHWLLLQHFFYFYHHYNTNTLASST